MNQQHKSSTIFNQSMKCEEKQSTQKAEEEVKKVKIRRWDQPGAHRLQKLQSNWDKVLPASVCTQTNWHHQNPVLPAQQVLDTTTHWKTRFKFKIISHDADRGF